MQIVKIAHSAKLGRAQATKPLHTKAGPGSANGLVTPAMELSMIDALTPVTPLM